MRVSAMMLQHPTKNCMNCDGELYGCYYSCECGTFHTCTRAACLQDVENECPLHGMEFIRKKFVAVPPHVLELKRLDVICEMENRYRFMMHQQAMGNELAEM